MDVTDEAAIEASFASVDQQWSYQATKGGVVNMTRALAIEWARQGIRVNAVAPTWVRTQFIASLTIRPELMAEIARVTPLGRLAEPDEIAVPSYFLRAQQRP